MKQGSTAGHCAASGQTVKSGGAPSWPANVGVTNLNEFLASNPARGDEQLIGPADQSDMTRRIYEDTSNYTRVVADHYTNSQLVTGVNLCKSGVGGGTTCGQITSSYPQIIFEQDPPVGTSRNVYNQVFATVTSGCYPGDSGGPFFHRMVNNQARAAGEVSAYFLNVNGNRTTSCSFTSIAHIAAATSSHVWEGPA